MNTEMQIVEIDEIAQKIDEATEMADFLPDVTSEEGYEKSKRVSLDIGKFLTGLEKTRKAKKEYFLHGGKEVDRQAKSIAEKLVLIQLPHKEAYKDFDESMKLREEERKEAHKTRLAEIELFPSIYAEGTAAAIEAGIKLLNETSTDGMDEFEARAKTAKAESQVALKGMLEKKVKQEEDAAELARLQAEEAARKQKEREDSIRKEAAEKAEAIAKKAVDDKKAAEAAAKKADEDRIAAEKLAEETKLKAEKAAKKAKEDAEALVVQQAADKVIADELAEKNRIAAEKKATEDSEKAAENARKEEVKRQETVKKEEQKIIAKREADQAHIGKIRGETKDSLIKLGLDEAKAKEIVLAIHKGQVKNITISY